MLINKQSTVIPALVKYLEQEGTRVCDRIAEYAKRWKQTINVGKTVAQVSYTPLSTSVSPRQANCR
jgi:hypothetical protein